MSRYKSNKQALIIAALVILICLVCLTGATLALFTNDLNDGTIGIVATSGDVEIDIVDSMGVTLQDKALAFMTSSTEQDLIFQPGSIFYTQEFTVTNLGNIPVNFSLSVSKDDAFEEGEFDEAFEVWIVRASEEDYENSERITNFRGRLEVGESSESYILIVKMKETAGNEFQGEEYTGIGVTVYAVQGNAEIWE